MSVADQCPGGDRLRRLLNRVLVVVGTAVAGTWAAWLLGSGAATAAEQGLLDGLVAGDRNSGGQVATAPAKSTAPTKSGNCAVSGSRDGLGSTDLDSAELLGFAHHPESRRSNRSDHCAAGPSPARESDRHSERGEHAGGVLSSVTGSVDTVVHRAEPVLDSVGRAAGELLPESEPGRTLPGTVESGLGAVEDSLQRIVSETPDNSSHRPGGQAGDDASGPGVLPGPAVPAGEVPAPAHEDPSAHEETEAGSVVRASAHERHEPSAVRHSFRRSHDEPSPAPRPAPAPLPALPPAAPVTAPCGSADAHGASSNANTGVCGRSGHAQVSEPHASTVVNEAARVITGKISPQPGVTPD